MMWIYQTEKQEQMTKQKPENKYEQSSPEALHKMTFTRDTLHQIHDPTVSEHIRINLPTPWHAAYSAHHLYLRPKTKPSPLPSRPDASRLQAVFRVQ